VNTSSRVSSTLISARSSGLMSWKRLRASAPWTRTVISSSEKHGSCWLKRLMTMGNVPRWRAAGFTGRSANGLSDSWPEGATAEALELEEAAAAEALELEEAAAAEPGSGEPRGVSPCFLSSAPPPPPPAAAAEALELDIWRREGKHNKRDYMISSTFGICGFSVVVLVPLSSAWSWKFDRAASRRSELHASDLACPSTSF
jgi:hypothetical protein